MSILDPKADAAALEPLEKEALADADKDLKDLAAALVDGLRDAVEGMTVTVTIQIQKKGT